VVKLIALRVHEETTGSIIPLESVEKPSTQNGNRRKETKGGEKFHIDSIKEKKRIDWQAQIDRAAYLDELFLALCLTCYNVSLKTLFQFAFVF
jgi:hypothetical protein